MGKKILFLFACLFMTASVAFAQRQITGTVVDSETNEPIPGATVKVQGTTMGTLTNVDGKFTLSNVPTSSKTIVVSCAGMKTAEVPIRGTMNVILVPDTKAMDEVMVVAFGTAKKSAYTGSAKVVGSEELQKAQVSNVISALAGAVPGMQLTSSNGAPGSSPTVRVRGFSSINAGKGPLYVIDGSPMSPDWDIANLNPNDVESVTVLKDAASNSLYGARGANGVIMITTKKAKQGEATINVDAKWGSNSRALRQYNVITDPAQYYETHYTALNNYYLNNGMSANAAWMQANQNLCGDQGNGGLGYNVYSVPDGQYMIGQNGKLNPNATMGRLVNYRGQDYLLSGDDWLDQSTENGFRQEYNVTATASSERSNFYANVGYLSDEGITVNSNMKRFSGRLKADYRVKKWAKVGMNMSYARFDHNSLGNNGSTTSTGNIWATAMQVPSIYPFWIRDGQGKIMVDGDGIQMADYGNGTNAGYGRPFVSDAHPWMDRKLNTRNSEGNANTGFGFADFYLYDGLTLTVNGTYNLDETRSTYVYNPYYGQFDTTGGTIEKYHTRLFSYNLQQLLNYTTSFRTHNNLNLLLGHEYTNDRYYYLAASKSKMFSQDNKELDGAVIDGQGSSSYKTEYNNEGYFFRGMYDWDERYFASGSVRRDASSRFHPDHRWGTFWSLGGAWRMSKEKWFNVSWIDELKLKASVGSQGNDDIGSYRYVDLYTITPSGGEIGTAFDSKGTHDISWETNTNINVGLEFELFKRRLTGGVEFFHRKTTDMLFSFSVAPSLGYSSYMDNVGDLWNRGVEIDLNANLVQKKNVQWDFNVNMAYLKNKITKLDPDKKVNSVYDMDGNEYKGYVSGGFFISEDISMYTWRRKAFAGVYTDQTWNQTGDEAYDPTKAGMSMWYHRVEKPVTNEDGTAATDDNGDPLTKTVTEATTEWSQGDYYMTKKSTVPPIYGGFGTTLRFYGFDLSANFSYQIGGYGYDVTYAQFMSSPTSNSTGYNYHADILKSWSVTNQNSDIPRFQYQDTYSAGQSDRFLTKASYLNIENINFGYTLPASVLAKLRIQGLRVYAAAENVFYWSKRRGFDPRQTYSDSANATRYSPMRSISAGINLTF
ncbi:MAG: TonB-dependent receptor [Bacteroidaceae bacterium]|nr:TonB-dependent receptor [Bacteroidaceae bacterium]